MALRDLRAYLELLESKGMLRRVRASVSPILEIPEVLRRVMRSRGPAVLFENVQGHPGWRVAGNIFCCEEAVALGLGVSSLDELGQRMPTPASLTRADVTTLLRYASYLPREARPDFEERPDMRLTDLPAFKSWPKDAGRYLTYALVVHRERGELGESTNFGVYRVMIVNEREAVVHWQTYKRGYAEHLRAIERGETKVPVALVIGADPGTLLAGAMPAPYPLDKYLVAGALRGEGVEVTTLPNGVRVPAHAEVVLEGTVDLSDLREEGPFGDHVGFYDKPDRRFPTFRLERAYARPDPIYYGTVVGRPPMEDSIIAKVAERAFLPLVRSLYPEVVDYSFPPSGWAQGLAVVSIRKTMPGQAVRVAMGLLGLGQFSLTKAIIVVDADIDPHDMEHVTWAFSTFVDPSRDIIVVPRAPADELDVAYLPRRRVGSKLIVDATRKLKDESGAEPPEELRPDEETMRLVDRRWAEYGL
jgi:3-octaprenyl-4hydroxybenzoate decarboxylase (EC 4.1.1.-)